MGEWSNLTQREKSNIIRFAIKNGVSDINQIRDTFNVYASGNGGENEYKEGGSIHIKHPGRLTALKERTGKTEAELWATGNAHTRKMITFARNARKWHKHEDGGSNWFPDFIYNPSIQSDNGRQLVQSVLQDKGIKKAVQQKALQRRAEIEAQRKAVSEIYNGMLNPGAGYVSGTDPLLQAIVDMTPAGDAEMATEAASELKNGNLKEAGILGAALLLPNIFNKGIKEWRAARALKNNERGLVYTTRNNLTKYNPNLNEETIQALQQAERDYNNGLFTLEHQSELDPIFELGLHTPAGKTAYPEGVEVWYRGLSKSKGKQVGITPEEFEEMWDKNVAAGKYSNLFFGDLNSARSYISGQTNPLEYARITGRNFPKGDDSKLLQLVFPKGRAVEIDANRAVWSDLSRIPFGKLSSKEEEMLKKASVAYDTEIKKQRLLQQRLDNYYKKHPEMLQSNSQSKWLQELQSKIDNSFYKVSDAHEKFMSLYKKKYPFSKTKDISDYLTHSNFSGVNLYNIQDYGPALYLYGTPGSVSIRKPVPGNYGKSAIASDFKFDLNDPSIWAFGGNLKSTGGPIHIAPSKRGTFTAAATKHGKSVQEFARQVLANKENYSPAMVRKAVFAHNSKSWKHADGGYLVGDEGGTETFSGGTLPEITIKPSLQDKDTLKFIREAIPHKPTRDRILQWVDEENTDVYATPYITTFTRADGSIRYNSDWKYNPRKDSYIREYNPMAKRIAELYKMSGRPQIYSTPSIGSKILGIVGLDKGMSTDRPHMNPVFNRLYNINSYYDLVAELSHSYNNKQIGHFAQGLWIPGGVFDRAYDMPYSMEHTTHSYTQPLLDTYIKSANVEGYENITPETINEEIKYQVATDREDLLNKALNKVGIKSTGGPLYPFSFQKNPYWKTPVVRYDDGGSIRNWDNTLTGKLINYVENSDSIGWKPIDRTWEHPTKPGYDKNQIGMGIDKNKTPGYWDHIQYRPETNVPFLTELDERLIRHNAIETANKSANARYKFAQETVNRPKGTVSPVKDAAVVSAIYNLGAGYVANGLFEDKDFMLKLFDGTDKEVVDRINQEYKKKDRNERIAKTNLFLFPK